MPGDDWTPPMFTAAPPPRDGMEQRWVRCRALGQDDVANVLRSEQKGWRPRPADTVPVQFQLLVGDWKKMPGVVQNQDSILMERPVERGDKMRAYLANQTRRLVAVVQQQVGHKLPPQPGTLGGAIDELEVKETVGNRRVPTIDD